VYQRCNGLCTEEVLLYPLFHVLDETMEKKNGKENSSSGMNGVAVVTDAE
jgi:hypothetical protein